MELGEIAHRGLVLLGCGKMGGALLKGWIGQGMDVSAVWVVDPAPSDELSALAGVNLNSHLPASPAIVVVAVKPQMMDTALEPVRQFGGRKDTLFLSVAAGTTLERFEAALGSLTPVIRAMPNTPAAIGRGITALVRNGRVSEAGMDMGEDLLSAVGQTVRLDREADMDAVTAVSGSGPAYVFHLIEALAAAGQAEGLSPELALMLARSTVAGAGALAEASPEDPGQLRVNVTSPGGTTEAALNVLMDDASGFPALVSRAVSAAAGRSRELGK
ncbi:MAG: pyrroline-5-carboxylate reductase [Boseongicola sp. SB0677_bin_26]|nr:pyrroline-5-carboxylate reductase [Boseongicola sp. SB0665_bin_10]MYG27520.1 pyrroline-5-carboxylate reductase [Boseongicola sp. SB0677_bin_26]